MLAYHLAKAGRQVLIVERGHYVEPRAFTEDEVDMVGKLYADGVFQQTQDYHFTVLQGSCVGGSTVVNNAVSFEPPEPVLARWNDPAVHAAGLDLPRLRASAAEVIRLLSITKQDGRPLNPRARIPGRRGRDRSTTRILEVDAVRANINAVLAAVTATWGAPSGRSSRCSTPRSHGPSAISRSSGMCGRRRGRAPAGGERPPPARCDSRAVFPPAGRHDSRAQLRAPAGRSHRATCCCGAGWAAASRSGNTSA